MKLLCNLKRRMELARCCRELERTARTGDAQKHATLRKEFVRLSKGQAV